MKKYAGVGSRDCLRQVFFECERIGYDLAKEGYMLRSGAAEGCDNAFEQGCQKAGGQSEIFLPWPNFNGHTSGLCHPPEKAFQIAEEIHPAWERLTQGAQKLHARNIQQVLGQNLNDPVEFVVCWTKDGKIQGGTATAINLAKRHGIAVFNLALERFRGHDKGWLHERGL